MPRRSAAYPPAYREQIIALAGAGRTSKELAKAFEQATANQATLCGGSKRRGSARSRRTMPGAPRTRSRPTQYAVPSLAA